jgi:hypothetical protein
MTGSPCAIIRAAWVVLVVAVAAFAVDAPAWSPVERALSCCGANPQRFGVTHDFSLNYLVRP